MAKHQRKRPGRPRKTGERKPSGQLRWKPPGPNEVIVEQRKALLNDDKGLHRADNPLDLAHARGWLTEREHRAGESFARLHRSAGLASPGLSNGALPEADFAGQRDIRTWNELSDAEISEVWARVMSKGVANASDGSSKSMDSWVAICAVLSANQLREVELVCIHQSWPQWVIQRCAGHFDTAWERKFRSLQEGLAIVAETIQELNPQEAKASPAEQRSFGEMNVQPAGRIVEETTIYTDAAGVQLFEAVRRRRVV